MLSEVGFLPMPVSPQSFLARFREAIVSSGLVTTAMLNAAESEARAAAGGTDGGEAAVVRATIKLLIDRGKLTSQQADQLVAAMQSPRDRFEEAALASGVVSDEDLKAAEADLQAVANLESLEEDAIVRGLAEALVKNEVLTPFQANQLLLGRKKLRLGQYRILDQIGRGGMGLVFLAEHELMGRQVAIKVLSRKKSNEDSEQAFLREIRVLGRLDHENLVRALDAGYDGLVFFLVTELIPGLDLNRQVKRHGVLDEMTAASVISQAATALAYAHAEGVVHRDVKPGNIIVTDEGVVKLLDLGLAGSMVAGEKVELNRIVGTMDYIAPEQLLDPDNVGPSADIYSLGCTLYFAVTGKPPFSGGDKKEKAQRHLHTPDKERPDPRDLNPLLSAAFSDVVTNMMLKEPTDRYQTMEEVIDALQSWRPEGLVAMSRAPGDAVVRPPVPGELPNGSAGPGDSNVSRDGWVLDADDVLPPSDSETGLGPPGRDDALPELDSLARQAVRIGLTSAVAGLAGWGVVATGVASLGLGSVFSLGPVLAGILACGLTAGGMSLAVILRSS